MDEDYWAKSIQLGLEHNGNQPLPLFISSYFLSQNSQSSNLTMASCSFGASSLKLYNLRLGPATVEFANLQQNCHGFRLRKRFEGLMLSQVSRKTSDLCVCLPAKNVLSGTDLQDSPEEGVLSESTSELTPNASQVESLVAEICDTTSIAEFELKLGGFRLYVLRNLAGETTSSPLQVSAPIVSTNVDPSEQNGSALSPSLAITKAEPASGGIQTFLDTDTNDGFAIIQSPRVGYFRRSRTIKGKRAPPPCKEKQVVKEGQVICYIEQLGGELQIESDVAGEVIKILRKDGDPVGYGDALIAILPSFPGIKKLQ